MYIRYEFKRHKDCNEAEAMAFLAEYERCAVKYSRHLGVFANKPAEPADKHVNGDNKHRLLSHYATNWVIKPGIF